MKNYNGTLSLEGLYPHLSNEDIKRSLEFDEKYDVEVSCTSESDRLLLEKNNADADLFCPVMSSGWRGSDIDSLERLHDPRLVNILNSRLQPLGVDPENTLSDDELLHLVVPRNLTPSTVGAVADEYNYLRESALDLIAKQSEQATKPLSGEE